MKGASYAFLPWIRRGISAAMGDGSSVEGRRTVPLEVSFGGDRQAAVTLGLFGPGEVVGLDARVVIRTWPVANVHEAEPNFFPLIEFDQAWLPWWYTPEAVRDHDRLRPWLSLIVLKEEEIEDFVPASETRPLPVVTVSDAPLPLLDQAWAWAHVQVTGVQSIEASEAGRLLDTEPHRLISRLLCPRRLDPATRYTALLVPTFEAGRRAGLGMAHDDDVDPVAPAWTRDARAIQLPAYYHWRFTTAVTGDFEDLAKRLKPRELLSTVGLRDMEVRDPGAGLPPASQGPLGLEGALKAPTTESTHWPDEERSVFVSALGRFLNLPHDLLSRGEGQRAISGPLYGRWHAARDRLAPGQEPVWFQEVNSDPRWRVAAGLGTRVVQANQRQLIASAWRQVQGVDDVNDQLRLAQFSRELAARVVERHLVDDDELVLQVTSSLHRRVLNSPTTIAARLEHSPIADGALSSGWRRLARPLGPIGRRQGRPRGERPQVVARLNRGELSPAPPPLTPGEMATPSRAAADLVPDQVNATSIAQMRTLAQRLLPLGWIAIAIGAALLLFAPFGVVAAPIAGALGISALAAAPWIRRRADRLEIRLAVRDSALSERTIATIPARPTFVATESALVGGTPPSQPQPGNPGEDSPSARAFRVATSAVLASVANRTVERPPLQPVSLNELRNKLLAEVDPAKSIGAAQRARLRIADSLHWRPLDTLEPVLAGPEFPQPMYRYLAEMSQDWLLPGVDQVPANTVTLVETNQRFVEGFMLGLNHEMGRELLWREYPTDQRRTYFRRFWDPSGFIPPNGEPPDYDSLKDILPIHRWRPSSALGENSARDTASREQLVLLVRGDVIHRHPNLMVYATRAAFDEQQQERVLGSEEQQPIFSGTLEPDIAFFGFPLTVEQVRGSANPQQGDPGWFFVLQEQPSEPRFGLDLGEPVPAPLADWNDMHWEHLVPRADSLDNIQYIDLNNDLPDARGVSQPENISWHADRGLGRTGTNAAHLAHITLQRPVRIAPHAADMLPAASD